MTKTEAEKVLLLMTYADGDCYHCAGKLIRAFVREFPKYKDEAQIIYKHKFGQELYKDD